MYKNKYLKYKQKYLYLKGGAIISKNPDTAASIMKKNIEAIKNEFKKISIIYENKSQNLCFFMPTLSDDAEYLIENEGLKKEIIDWAIKYYKGKTITKTDIDTLRYDINAIIANNTNELIKKLKDANIQTACENVVKNNLEAKDDNSKLIKSPLKFNYIINRFLKSNYALSALCPSTEYTAICTSTEYTAIYIEAIKNKFNEISIIYGYGKNNSRSLCAFMSSLCDKEYLKYLIENEGLIEKIIVRAKGDNDGNTITETGKNKLTFDINTIIDTNTNELIKKLEDKNINIKTACEIVVAKNLEAKDDSSKLIPSPLKFNYIINRFLKSDYALSAALYTSTEYSICTSTEYTNIYKEYNRIMYDKNTPEKITKWFGLKDEDFDAYNKRHGNDLIVALGNTTKTN